MEIKVLLQNYNDGEIQNEVASGLDRFGNGESHIGIGLKRLMAGLRAVDTE